MLFGKNKTKKLNDDQLQLVNDCMDWCFFAAIKELREREYEGDPKHFPEDVREMLAQYMIGAIFFVIRDLDEHYNISKYKEALVVRAVSFIYKENEKDKLKTQITLAACQDPDRHLSSFFAGERAATNFFEAQSSGVGQSEWLDTYKGMFGACVGLFSEKN